MKTKFDPSRRRAIKLLATGVSVLSVQKFLFADAVLRAVEREGSTETLAGEWSFALDEKNEGIADEWFNRGLAGQIKLPGSMDQAGKGYPLTGQSESLASICTS